MLEEVGDEFLEGWVGGEGLVFDEGRYEWGTEGLGGGWLNNESGDW